MAKAPSDNHTRTRESPRISANDLARYMVAGDTGKIGIIRRARDSSTAARVRYKDARLAIRSALCDLPNERRIIAAARSTLEQKADDGSLSPFSRDDAEKSVDALDAFLGMRNKLAGFDFKPAPRTQDVLNISGVDVSVYSDLLIQRTQKEEEQIGGVLFRLTVPEEDETERAAEKRKEMGLYAATLVHMHVAANLAGNRSPHHSLCWSVDVQNTEVYAAPRNFLTRTTSMENACRFIAALWKSA